LDQNVADPIFSEKNTVPLGGWLRSGGARRSAQQFAAKKELTPFRSGPDGEFGPIAHIDRPIIKPDAKAHNRSGRKLLILLDETRKPIKGRYPATFRMVMAARAHARQYCCGQRSESYGHQPIRPSGPSAHKQVISDPVLCCKQAGKADDAARPNERDEGKQGPGDRTEDEPGNEDPTGLHEGGIVSVCTPPLTDELKHQPGQHQQDEGDNAADSGGNHGQLFRL
jgi:hypothetical protein